MPYNTARGKLHLNSFRAQLGYMAEDHDNAATRTNTTASGFYGCSLQYNPGFLYSFYLLSTLWRADHDSPCTHDPRHCRQKTSVADF